MSLISLTLGDNCIVYQLYLIFIYVIYERRERHQLCAVYVMFSRSKATLTSVFVNGAF